MEVFVDQAGGIADDDRTAVFGEVRDATGILVGQGDHGGQHDSLVAAPIVGERDHVRARSGIEISAIPVAYVMPVIEFHAGQGLGASGPFGFRTEQNRRVRALQFRVLHTRVGQRLQRGAEFAHSSKQFRIGARVGHHRGVERLGTRCGLPPLEEVDGVGTHGHVGQGVAHELAGALAHVKRLPLDGGGGVLHHVPRLAERERVHERVRAGEFVQMGFALMEVVIVGHEVHFVCPLRVVHGALVGGDHEVRGERLAGADFFDGVAFGLVEVEQHVVAEPLVIQLLGRVDHAVAAHVARQQHLVEAVHVLGPEGRAPRFVQRVDGPVFGLAPRAERGQGVVGVVVAVVPAVFVAHVPGRHVWIVLVVFGKFAAQAQRVFLEHRACGLPRLA